MKVMIVGALTKSDVKELQGMPVVVLTGSLDDIRRCGAVLYQEVEVAQHIEPTALASTAQVTETTGEKL